MTSDARASDDGGTSWGRWPRPRLARKRALETCESTAANQSCRLRPVDIDAERRCRPVASPCRAWVYAWARSGRARQGGDPGMWCHGPGKGRSHRAGLL